VTDWPAADGPVGQVTVDVAAMGCAGRRGRAGREPPSKRMRTGHNTSARYPLYPMSALRARCADQARQCRSRSRYRQARCLRRYMTLCRSRPRAGSALLKRRHHCTPRRLLRRSHPISCGASSERTMRKRSECRRPHCRTGEPGAEQGREAKGKMKRGRT